MKYDFYIPRYKWQFIAWFKRHFPEYKISGMSNKKLAAIYIQKMKGFRP